VSRHVVHFELPYDDGDRARAFYGELFGWDLQSYPGSEYTMVSTGPTTREGPSEAGFINGGMGPRNEGGLRTPVVVIDVDDIDATLADIEAKGGSVVQPRSPVGEMGWMAYFTDTESNVVGLWQTAPQS